MRQNCIYYYININKQKFNKIIITFLNPELTKIVFDKNKSREIILNGSDRERLDLVYASINLPEHHHHYPLQWEIDLDGRTPYRCKHEFSKSDLISWGICCYQDFYKNGPGRDRFKGVARDNYPFHFCTQNLQLTKKLKSKLNKLHRGFYNAEIIARTADKESGALIHPEYLDFEFCGRVHREDILKLEKKDLLFLPKWSLFISDSEHIRWPLIARHYDLTYDSYHYFRRFSPNDIGEIVMGKTKEYGIRKFSEANIKYSNEQYSKIKYKSQQGC